MENDRYYGFPNKVFERNFRMNTRINFASLVEYECLKNPELVTNFISIVASELSNIDLIRIQQRFLNSKTTVYKKLNLNN